MNRSWRDDPDYGEYLADQKEADLAQRERELNTVPKGQKWAPADFLYDTPGSKKDGT